MSISPRNTRRKFSAERKGSLKSKLPFSQAGEAESDPGSLNPKSMLSRIEIADSGQEMNLSSSPKSPKSPRGKTPTSPRMLYKKIMKLDTPTSGYDSPVCGRPLNASPGSEDSEGRIRGFPGLRLAPYRLYSSDSTDALRGEEASIGIEFALTDSDSSDEDEPERDKGAIQCCCCFHYCDEKITCRNCQENICERCLVKEQCHVCSGREKCPLKKKPMLEYNTVLESSSPGIRLSVATGKKISGYDMEQEIIHQEQQIDEAKEAIHNLKKEMEKWEHIVSQRSSNIVKMVWQRECCRGREEISIGNAGLMFPAIQFWKNTEFESLEQVILRLERELQLVLSDITGESSGKKSPQDAEFKNVSGASQNRMATMTNIGTQSFGGTKVSPNKSLSSTGEFAMRSSGSLSQYDGVPRRQRENTFDEVREDQSKARLEAKTACEEMLAAISDLNVSAFYIARIAPSFDMDESVPGNGWRSFLDVLESSLKSLLCYIQKKDKKWRRHLRRNSTVVIYLLTWLTIVNISIEDVLDKSAVGIMFPAGEYEGVLNRLMDLPLHVFYGHFFGVQYTKGLRQIFGFLLVAMASYGDGMKSGEGLRGKIRAVMTSTKYLAFNKKAAFRTAELFSSGDLGFLKAFWELQENVSFVELDTAIRTPKPAVNMVMKIPVRDIWGLNITQLFLEHHYKHYSSNKEKMKGMVAESCQYPFDARLKRGIFKHVQVRLVSYHRHKGQSTSRSAYEDRNEKSEKSKSGLLKNLFDDDEEEPPPINPHLNLRTSTESVGTPKRDRKNDREKMVLEPASGLLIHIHGGGFVAQTSKAHLNYLRDYAKSLRVPILTVDYSLAPEAPFPQSLYEAFYAYCWALENAAALGTKAETVVMTGDSAGANLVIAVTMMAIEKNIRVPDRIIPIYPALLAKQVPSPSRLLSVMDPLLGTGVLLKCLYCYSSGLENYDSFMSPAICSDEILQKFPPIQLVVGKLDPLLDDTLFFAQHLKRNNVPLHLHLLDGLPHGFLGFNHVCAEATRGTQEVIHHLMYAFGLEQTLPEKSVLIVGKGERRERRGRERGERGGEEEERGGGGGSGRGERGERERGEEEEKGGGVCSDGDKPVHCMGSTDSSSLTGSTGSAGKLKSSADDINEDESNGAREGSVHIAVYQKSEQDGDHPDFPVDVDDYFGLEQIGYLRGLSNKFVVEREIVKQEKSFQFRAIHRKVNLKEKKITLSVSSFKNLKTGKYISRGHFTSVVTATGQMWHHEAIDIARPKWEIYRNRYVDSVPFRLGKDKTLRLCQPQNQAFPLYFKIVEIDP